jgi:hypothetical protein
MSSKCDTDEDLWEKSKSSDLKPEHISWFFHPDMPTKKICVLNTGKIREVLVETRTLMELAIFDTMAAFWETLQQSNHLAKRYAAYHKLLRQTITNDLVNSAPAMTHETPSILHPWLQRTLCLLGHDEDSRKTVETFNYPKHLCDDGVF